VSVELSQAVREAVITRYAPHCIGWARATASLWGVADDHDLDEPVILTNEVPVRVRYDASGTRYLVRDRALTLKTIRAGHHAALRLYFKDGKFFETEIIGVQEIGRTVETIEIIK
jgi:hypothetical protein